MNTSGGHEAFLIAYHLHTNNGHHWFAAQCVQLINGLMHDLFHPFTTLHWIPVWSVPGHRAYRLSYLELTLALVRFASICFPFEIPSTGLMEICALSNQPLPIDSVVFDLFLSLVFVFLGVKTLFSQKWHRWVLESLCQSMAFVSCLPLNFIFGRRHSKFSAGEISVDAVIWLDQWGKLFLIQTRWPVVPHCPVLCALPWTLVRGIVFF